MKELLPVFCVCIMISSVTKAQVTYLADTAFTTDVGYDGAGASCRAPHTEYFGWQMGRAQGSWVADVFTVPPSATWAFDTVIVYGYQYGSGTTSTFLNCNLQIYQGTPGLGGTVVWGDTSTNVLNSTGFTGIYRVDTFAADGGLTSTNRPIMFLKLYLSPAPILTEGTYWLSWSSAGSSASIPDAPDKVLPGRINPSGQTARQLFGGTWYYIRDSSDNIGMDMIIKASAAVAGVSNVNQTAPAILDQNTPNPFSNTTEISFYMPQSGHARVTVYNTIGQLVTTVFDGEAAIGEHHVTLTAENLPAGLYYCRLLTSTAKESKQMLLIK